MTQAIRLLTAAACLGLGLSAGAAHAATWSDNAIGYRYSPGYTEPGVDSKVTKNILSFTHASGYAYGQNFLNIDLLQSSSNDPANGGSRTDSSTGGATEAYVTYRHQLSMGKVFERNLSFGPVKDLALTAGIDLNTKNTAFAPRKRLAVFGPTLKFDVPHGFVDLSLLWGKEWNHCGASFCQRQDIAFDPQWIVSLAWGVPFQLGAVPMKFQGFANYNSKKGPDYNGKETKPEFLLRTSVMADVGKLMFDKKNTLWAGIGYEYWHNKFGNPPGTGTLTNTPTLQVEYHF